MLRTAVPFSEAGDGTKDGKQMMRLFGIDIRQPVLMVVLQQERSDVPSRDFLVVKRELGIDDIASDHPFGLGEIMLVMTVGAAEGDHGRHGVATPPRPPSPLTEPRHERSFRG
jgi:hypothetical protein